MGKFDRCPIGLYEKALPAELTWEQRLLAAKKAGYDFVEISIDETDERLGRLDWTAKEKAQFRTIVGECGVPVLTMCLSGNRRFPIGSENALTRQKGIDVIKKAVDFSLDVGVRIIQLAGYDEYYEPRNSATEKLFYDALCEVAKYAAERAVMLAIENVDTEFMNTVGKIEKYVAQIDSPWLAIYPDIGNLYAAGLELVQIRQEFQEAAGRIVAIHAKDALPATIRKVGYGTGLVDFRGFFAMLSSLNYRGPFVVEMWSDGSAEPEKDIVEALRFIREKMEEGGKA